MNSVLDGNAIVYCEGAYNTTNGKTAHGLVRFTKRYKVIAVIDSRYAGRDAGEVLDNKINSIPIFGSIEDAMDHARNNAASVAYFVIGLAPDGGRLNSIAREDVKKAIGFGLNVDCGLHDFLSEDPEIAQLAMHKRVTLRDLRKPPPRNQLHFFSGKIEEVNCLKVAILGTDSAIGKRTTAWLLVHALQKAGYKAEMVGTGQTAWMQGAKYSTIFDTLVNDFVSGEIEHAVWSAWKEENPDVIIIEGQGSLMNPAYPGGYEMLAAGRPDIVVLQHAPARREYDGFPGYLIHPLSKQIGAIEYISDKPVVAITINHEDLKPEDIPVICGKIGREHKRPAYDVLLNGADNLARLVAGYLKKK
jgi:uncharacterized NAD-dependent epimerase/dehydratase family protein